MEGNAEFGMQGDGEPQMAEIFFDAQTTAIERKPDGLRPAAAVFDLRHEAHHGGSAT